MLSIIDRDALDTARKLHPNKAVVLSHQFLSGETPSPFGFVPNEWDGETIVYVRNDTHPQALCPVGVFPPITRGVLK